MRRGCGWDRGSWGARITLGAWSLLTFHLHLVPAVFVAAQAAVWGKGVVSTLRSSSLWVPASLPLEGAPLTPAAVALLGDTPELEEKAELVQMTG